MSRFYFMVRLKRDPIHAFTRAIEADSISEAYERIKAEFKGRYLSIEFSFEEVVHV